MNKPLVIYHGPGCLDGMAAAWNMYQLFGEEAEYVVGRYQSNDSIDFSERNIYLVDFSYKREFLIENILPFANDVYLIDHHKSALDELWDLPKDYQNFHTSASSIDYSGAILAWLFVHNIAIGDYQRYPGRYNVPALLKHIQDRDLWQFKLEGTKEITSALFSYELDYKSIHKFMGLTERGLQKLVAEGTTLQRAHEKECKVLMKIARRLFCLYTPEFDEQGFAGEACDVMDLVNAPPKYSSDIGNMIASEPNSGGVGGTYYDTFTSREFSLRSVGDIDVSEIAKKFGGGGHKNAAGFKVPRSHYLAKV